MKTSLRSVLSFSAAAVLALLASGCAIHVTHTESGNGSSKLSQSAAGNASFQCVASPSGECHYALYTSRCSTAEGEGGQPATTCTHQVISQFTVAAGQTREMRDLPQGFKQCMKTSHKPQVPSCGA
ncbi:hypothetical protein C1O66_18420 [Paucibacter aquatile]|uniref:Lipoprotein n=1 Tax=Kinneretia aquatilis TaxID=2070761 RepID=A0A2N8L0T6_9BURK|nr:hypothetical protein [Paucibacter aquatile]PND39306.1 hypothetical protein C1O66_18420 [Paucibacter aquatile]